MQTLEQLRDKHAKDLAKAEKNHAMQLAVTEALDLSDDNWPAGFMHAYRCDCHIKMTAETLNDALTLAEKMNPLHMVRVKDSCLSFIPMDRATEKEEPHSTSIAPYIYKIEGISGYPVTKTLVFYVEAAGYVVQVKVSVTNDPLTDRSTYQPRDARNRECGPLETTLHNGSGVFLNSARMWASPGEPKDFILYSA